MTSMRDMYEPQEMIKRATGMSHEDTIKRFGEYCDKLRAGLPKEESFTKAEYEQMLSETLEESSRLLEENERLRREIDEQNELRLTPELTGDDD